MPMGVSNLQKQLLFRPGDEEAAKGIPVPRKYILQ